MTKQPERQPAEVTAEEGEVMMDGPNGLSMSLTPDAAHRTAQALNAAAGAAELQPLAIAPPSRPGERETSGRDQT